MPARYLNAGSSVRLVAACTVAALNAGPFGALAYSVEPGSRLDTLMHELAQRQHGHASFVERQYLAILDRPLESSGELFYDAPNHIEKRTLLPKPASLMLDGGIVTIRRGTRTYTASLRDYPLFAALLESIRATLAGDRASLEQAYTLSFTSEKAEWTLGLVPRDRAVAAIVARVRIAGAEDTVREVEIRRADGDRSVMTIKDLLGK